MLGRCGKPGSNDVKVKAGTGREDQGGGPIWRVLDKDNYYIVIFYFFVQTS